MNELDENHLQLVTDLAADYSEKIVCGQPVSMKNYIDNLPNDASRRAFRRLANMTKLLATIGTLKPEEIDSAAAADKDIDAIPVSSSI